MTPNIRWKTGDALDVSFLGDEQFDVALGMETIEHFTYEDAVLYVGNISSHLKNRGVFIGTSSFPKEEETAKKLCEGNEFHKHIFTFSEMKSILDQHFRKHKILNNWLFIARK